MRVESLLLQDHLAVVVLALGVGQADHGQQLGTAQGSQDVRVVVQPEDGLQELNEREGKDTFRSLRLTWSISIKINNHKPSFHYRSLVIVTG